MRVLITGAAGCIGSRLTAALEAEYELVLGDVQPLADERFVALDVTRPGQIAAAMEGAEAVVHLAIASGHEGPVEDDEFNQRRFDVNVRGTFNILEAARRAGVQRIVHASSLMVVWGYPPPEWVAADAVPRPVGSYAITKHLCEVMCREFSRSHGLSIVCLRIPKPVDLDDLTWKGRSLRPQWIAFPDLCEAFRRALKVGGVDFEVVTIVADGPRCRWDLSKAERLLGWRPRLRLHELGYDVGDESVPIIDESITDARRGI